MAEGEAGFTWDMENEEDRDRYMWSRDEVLAWWEAAGQGRWYRREAAPMEVDDRWAPRTAEDEALKTALEAEGFGWWTQCGSDDDSPRFWDPFHLPLFDPHTGELSPKHPDATREWSDALRTAFTNALWARITEGRDAVNASPCQGFVVPPNTDFSLPEDTEQTDDAEVAAQEQDGTTADNPELFVNFFRSLFGRNFMIRRRVFGVDKWRDGELYIGAMFAGAAFAGRANFENARFKGEAVFQNARFKGEAVFQNARFKDWADFESARFKGRAFFQNARFKGWTFFGNARFKDVAVFESARFKGRAFFQNARFKDWADFGNARFKDWADFDAPPRVEKAAEGEADPHLIPRGSFAGAKFYGNASFVNRIFGSGISFGGVEFHGRAMFEGADLHPDMDFYRAQFLRHKGSPPVPPEFEKPGQDDSFLKHLFGPFRRLAWWPRRAWWSVQLHWPLWQTNVRALRDRGTERLERDYRTLKLKMEEIRSRTEEAEFFGHELKCRLNRADVPLIERAFLRLYWLTSDFGRGLGRSLLSIVLWHAAAAGAYRLFAARTGWPLGAETGGSADMGAQILQFVIQQSTRPFAVWTEFYRRYPASFARPYVCEGAETTADCSTAEPAAHWLYLQILASIQSLGVLVLVFIFLVVVRRRFQMN